MSKIILLAVVLACLGANQVWQTSEITALKKELAAQKVDGDLAAAAAVKQFEKDVFEKLDAADKTIAQRAAADQAAIRNDMKALPADNFRQQPKKWGDN